MKRRDFLKLIGACIVAPSVVVTTTKPKQPKKILVYDKTIHPKGVTDEQLRDLIQTTLKSIPKGYLVVNFR